MLAWFAAAVSLWLGACSPPAPFRRGYQWLAGAAALYCAGLIIPAVDGLAQGPVSGAVAGRPAVAAGGGRRGGGHHGADQRRAVRGAPGRRPGSRGRAPGRGARGHRLRAGSVLPGLADGYVMAVALLVIGWVPPFSAEFHRSGERPGTFLVTLMHALADLAVLDALLPLLPRPGAGRCRIWRWWCWRRRTRWRWASGSLGRAPGVAAVPA